MLVLDEINELRSRPDSIRDAEGTGEALIGRIPDPDPGPYPYPGDTVWLVGTSTRAWWTRCEHCARCLVDELTDTDEEERA
ncbi:hypothetical protein [Actinoalloteichus sp. GBA129-24]|uniref:hypothetical protein n=1 Tax=Actinoalloteichus sp. GBA129-24 TaxID=1612551 RepID=UPI00095038F8|nr:hypothetical protein [Actinoalloteichus sp. GBA129-24]APU20963.1 hypothetical protein UA75_14765 [Actinoalloteichus sp. GBA129-24]APU24212.1 hypothetical protein UA75_31245 [Actinoalloteichus sp. GBA129-24]